ncbi:MAG: triose-phosphate isomerase [Lapillicoccus sp.]
MSPQRRAGVHRAGRPALVRAIRGALLAAGSRRLQVGAQDLATEDAGAYPEDVSGAELAELGCTNVGVGHAEQGDVDGLFLGRFAQDPPAVETILDELASVRV